MGYESARRDGQDVVDVLKREHDRIRALLPARRDGGDGDGWATFCELSDLLIRHEVAEELVVYPELHGLRDGTAVRVSRLADQAGIEELLGVLVRRRSGSPGFDRDAVQLGLRVLAHLEMEEAQVFPLLTTFVDPQLRADLGARYLNAMTIVRAPRGAPVVRSGPTLDRTTTVSTFMPDSVGPAELAS